MADKKKRVLISAPAGEAIWPKLHEPDTKFKKEGEFGTKVAYDPTEPAVAAYIAKVEELVDQAFEQAKDQNPKFAKVMKRVSPVKPELDDNGDETGRVVMNYKKIAQVTSKKDGKVYNFRVMLYDAGLAPLPKGVRVGSGSRIRVSWEPYFYFNPKDKEAGVSLRLEAVQVIELREYKGKDGSDFGFETEEGGFDGTQLPDRDDTPDEFQQETGAAPAAAGKRGDF